MMRKGRILLAAAPLALVLLASPTPPAAKTVGRLLDPEPVLLALSPTFSLPASAPLQTQPPSAPAAAPPPPEAQPIEPGPSPRRTDGVQVVVSIPQQKAYVFIDGELFGTSPVSTGRRGHETPVGRFRILEKDIDHRSNKYSNAPMPFMQRLTTYGIALHAGHLPGYPASHGCIRMPWGFARKLYRMTDSQTRVTITRQRPHDADEALSLV